MSMVVRALAEDKDLKNRSFVGKFRTILAVVSAILAAVALISAPAFAATKHKATQTTTDHATASAAARKPAVRAKVAKTMATPHRSAPRTENAKMTSTKKGTAKTGRHGRVAAAHTLAGPTRASDLAHRENSDRCTEEGRQNGLQGTAWENFMVTCR
jgi:hypothetical protein